MKKLVISSKTQIFSEPTAKTSAERMRRKRKLDAEDPERKNRKLDSLFMFNCVEISIILDTIGNVWFKEVDLARALDMENSNTAVSENIAKKYTINYENISSSNTEYPDILNMHPKTTFVNESSMNLIVLRSRKPRAEAFAEWVCAEVFPSIRKTGKYEIADPNNNPYKELNDFLKQQVEDLKLEKKELSNQLSTAIETVARVNGQMFSMRPSCIAPERNELKEEYVVLYRKYRTEEQENIEDPELLHFPYYACRVQIDSLKEREAELLTKRYPTLELLRQFKLPNSVNFFNHIMEEMGETLERGRCIHVQSFRIKNNCTSENEMLRSIENLYRIRYSE